MRHNSHIFEPEAVQAGTAVSSRWYHPYRPRTSVIIQGLPGSGKSTLANALCGRLSLFPYLTTTRDNRMDRKPSVAVRTYGQWTSGEDQGAVPQWQCDLPRTSLQYRLFAGPSGVSFSRSLSDSMFRSASSGGSTSSVDSSPRTTTCLPTEPVHCYAYQVDPDARTPWAAMGHTLESLLRSELQEATCPSESASSEVAFVHLSVNHADASTCAEPEIVTIVESQAPDDRPAMHLTHTVVFVLAEDEAFAPTRREHAFDAMDARRAERQAALVANISAVTTCDGDKCRCCLVVNMGRRLFADDDDSASGCMPIPPAAAATAATLHAEGSFSSSTSDFVVVEERGGDECNWPSAAALPDVVKQRPRDNHHPFTAEAADEARLRLGRKWRIPASNVFFFSAQHTLADRLTAALASTTPGVDPSTCCTDLDRREWLRWMHFVNLNAQRGVAEWASSRLPRRDPRPAACGPPADASTVHDCGSPAQTEAPASAQQRHATSTTTNSSGVGDALFVKERCERTEREVQRLQSKQHEQSVLVRSIVERAQEDQAEAARRVVARTNTSYCKA